MITVATWLVRAAGLYLAVGLVLSLPLHARGLARIDPAVRGAGVWFRVLVTPGLVALWPLLVGKWRRAVRGEATGGAVDRPVTPEGLRAAHRTLAVTAAAVSCAVLLFGVWRRGAEPEPSRIDYPASAPTTARELVAGIEFEGLPVHARVLVDETGRRELEVTVDRDPGIPRPVLYLGEGPSAILLGVLRVPGTARYPLPAGGTVSIYSLGYGEVVGTADVEVD